MMVPARNTAYNSDENGHGSQTLRISIKPTGSFFRGVIYLIWMFGMYRSGGGYSGVQLDLKSLVSPIVVDVEVGVIAYRRRLGTKSSFA
jgi:hypothetical protein